MFLENNSENIELKEAKEIDFDNFDESDFDIDGDEIELDLFYENDDDMDNADELSKEFEIKFSKLAMEIGSLIKEKNDIKNDFESLKKIISEEKNFINEALLNNEAFKKMIELEVIATIQSFVQNYVEERFENVIDDAAKDLEKELNNFNEDIKYQLDANKYQIKNSLLTKINKIFHKAT